MSNFEEESSIPTGVVLARMAGELIEISVGDENANPKLVIYTTGEPTTGNAVEALRRSYPTELIRVSPTKRGGPAVLHVVQDISQLRCATSRLAP